MPQTPKKQKDTYPISPPPTKVNQRTGDAAPGQGKYLTRLANNRASITVNRLTDIGTLYDSPNRPYKGFYKRDYLNVPRTDAYYEEINPLRKFKLDSETLQKNLVRSNQVTDSLKLPQSDKGKAAQIQSKAAPKPSVIETAAKTAAGTGVLASPLAKGVGAIGVVAAAQKGAGLPPKQENAAVDEWNKRTNYGRIQGPTSKALGVVNVKPGSK